MPHSWQKNQRLLKRAEFQACYNEGEKHFTKLFIVFVKKAPSCRIGLAVSKKSGNAVQRNRIKRILREFFRLYFEKLENAELVIVPKKHVDAGLLRFVHVEKDLLPFVERLSQQKASDGRESD